jgi:hypothetical protein
MLPRLHEPVKSTQRRTTSPPPAGHEAPELDPDDRIPDHRSAERTSEQAFDRLNPTFGVPADRADRIGHRDIQQLSGVKC